MRRGLLVFLTYYSLTITVIERSKLIVSFCFHIHQGKQMNEEDSLVENGPIKEKMPNEEN